MSDTETDEAPVGNADSAETGENAPETQPDGSNVEIADNADDPIRKLRKENAERRTKTREAEERAEALAKRLHRELVKATNRLENAEDLSFDAEHLDDADKLSAAIDALLADRPYFAKRKVSGDAGQGPRGGAETGPTFADLFRGGR